MHEKRKILQLCPKSTKELLCYQKQGNIFLCFLIAREPINRSLSIQILYQSIKSTKSTFISGQNSRFYDQSPLFFFSWYKNKNLIYSTFYIYKKNYIKIIIFISKLKINSHKISIVTIYIYIYISITFL